MRIYISFYLLLIFLNTFSQSAFDDYFTGERLRIDYTLIDSAQQKYVISTALYKELVWSGSRNSLIDSFRYGEMRLELFDSGSGGLIYSYGFSTLYNEWQSTRLQNQDKVSFQESLVMPFPKQASKLVISERGANMEFAEIYKEKIFPQQITGLKEAAIPLYEYRNLIGKGTPANKLDIVILSEGYTTSEKEKFFADAMKLGSSFSMWEPYASSMNKLNVSAYFIPSVESGVSNPVDSTFRNTAFQFSFNTLGIERYLMSSEISLIRSKLSTVAYDQICVMVNTSEYGGGGIYNYLTVFAGGNTNSEFLFQHEFAHGLVCLADEYYSSQVTYQKMFNQLFEPYQPNITTLVDFDNKWESMLHDSIPVPTPNIRKYKNVVGVFEGAGYSAEGIYRSFYNCTMKSSGADGFCPVCKEAIGKMLDYYCD